VSSKLHAGGCTIPPLDATAASNWTKRKYGRKRIGGEQIVSEIRDARGQFVVGHRGGGRPLGARSKLSETALRALGDDFAVHGPAVIEKVRIEQPGLYLRIVASLLPRQLHVERTSVLADLSDEELDLIERTLRGNRAKPVELNGTAVELEPKDAKQTVRPLIPEGS
jgi:hypothetical protein